MKGKQKNLKEYLNKGISTPIGILAVLFVAVVAGVLIWQFLPSEEILSPPTTLIPDEPTPTPTPPPTPTPTDEIAGWEVYRNEEYGFLVRYPLDWKMEIKSDLISMGEVHQDGSKPFWVSWSKTIEGDNEFGEFWINFSIRTTANPDKPWNEFIEDNCTKWGKSEVKVDGRDATRCVSPTGPAGATRIWLVKDEIGWEILISGLYGEELEEISEQMLSTFKFID